MELLHQLNNSKYFLGFFIIVLNMGSKFINIKLNNFHEQLLRDTIGRELMIFAICFVGTRDILVALVMSSTFIILNDYLFNNESTLCIIPKQYRDKMRIAMDTNNDDKIDENEIKNAIRILNKAKQQRIQERQRLAYMTFMNNV
jgi:hypothetical protein